MMTQQVTMEADSRKMTVTVTVTRDADGSRRVTLAGSHFRRTNPEVTLMPSKVKAVRAAAVLRHSKGGGANQVWGMVAFRNGQEVSCAPQFGRLEWAVEAAAAAMMSAATKVSHFPCA